MAKARLADNREWIDFVSSVEEVFYSRTAVEFRKQTARQIALRVDVNCQHPTLPLLAEGIAARKAKSARQKAELEAHYHRWNEVRQLLTELIMLGELLLKALLVTAGYYQHRGGEWRLRYWNERGKRPRIRQSEDTGSGR